MYGYAYDNGNLNSGWQTLGSWVSGTVVATPPTADSVTPNAGTGTSQNFTLKYSSVNGYKDLNTVYLLLNRSVNGAGACFPFYIQGSNALYLYNDSGTGVIGPLTPGVAGSLSNSQCTIDGAGSSVSGAGNTLSLTLAIAFKPAFAGPQQVFGYATDSGNLASGWQMVGIWTSQ